MEGSYVASGDAIRPKHLVTNPYDLLHRLMIYFVNSITFKRIYTANYHVRNQKRRAQRIVTDDFSNQS